MAENARECFDQLLRSLRESRLGWVAEEIEAETAAGRLVEKEWRESARRVETGLRVEDYSEGERLAIALQVLLERVQVAHAGWLEATEYLQRRLGVALVQYVDSDTSQAFEPFDGGFTAALPELVRVIRRVGADCQLDGSELDRLSRHAEPSLPVKP